MIQNIYKTILANGFTAKGQDVVNNKRLGIKRTFRDSKGHYIEIHIEDWGYSVIIYGGNFMSGYYPYRLDISNKNDINHLREKIEHTIG